MGKADMNEMTTVARPVRRIYPKPKPVLLPPHWRMRIATPGHVHEGACWRWSVHSATMFFAYAEAAGSASGLRP